MLPQIRKILYSTDLSKNSSYAFQYAVSLAKSTGADIHILHIVEKLSSDAIVTLQAYVLNKQSRRKILQERVTQAKALLEQRQNYFWEELAADEIEVRKQIVSIEVCESYPSAQIISRSKELSCDLIIMGTHEKGKTQMFLGSVAKNVQRHSRIPTMVVPLPVSKTTDKSTFIGN